jgi:hypothetical protein
VNYGTTMEDEGQGQVSSEDKPAGHSGSGWQVLWFLAHLAAVYALVNFFTPWLAGWTAGRVLPLLQHPTSSGPFQFFLSHIFGFSFLPALLLGLINSRFKHKAAQFVWLVPAVILAYKFVTFPAPSAFASQFSAAFHQYFAGGFLLPRSWRVSDMMDFSPELLRCLAQIQFAAPFYAGVGYSIAAWMGSQTDLSRKVADKVEGWEESRFGHQSLEDSTAIEAAIATTEKQNDAGQ